MAKHWSCPSTSCLAFRACTSPTSSVASEEPLFGNDGAVDSNAVITSWGFVRSFIPILIVSDTSATHALIYVYKVIWYPVDSSLVLTHPSRSNRAVVVATQTGCPPTRLLGSCFIEDVGRY